MHDVVPVWCFHQKCHRDNSLSPYQLSSAAPCGGGWGGGGILQHSLLKTRYVQLSHYQSCCLNQGEFLKLIFYIKEWIVPISAKPCSSFSSSFWCRYDPQQRYGCPRVHFDLNGSLTQPPIMASWPHSPEMVQECFVVT